MALLTGSDPGESAQTALLREGEKTMGVWLPLALADIMLMLDVVSKRAAGVTGKIDIINRSEILKAWMLPVMGEAMAEDEAEAAAVAMLNSVRNLKK